ncbi:MAG: 50S ribosomal protein L29 [Bdellovibrionales bacterium GWB1_55_8]|nr:MAG: 50S ribosomal protein L29 [Bdellovibrionales bacterium GWB1_55_8]
MATKKSNELKNLTKDELTTRIRDVQAKLFDGKMKKVTGQLSDTASLWKARKELARMKALLGAKTASAGGK